MPENGEWALAVEDLEVRYGPVVAVRELDLRVRAGEVLGLIGPNGAGKSSTLAAVMGLVEPVRGDIRLHGRSIVDIPPERHAALGLALVPEGRRIFASFDVEENLRLGLLGRRTRQRGNSSLEVAFELFPILHDRLHQAAGTLSGGEQQMLAIARALVSDPEVLLLDEPSLGLAPSIVESVMEALSEVRRRGVTILLVEQRAEMTVSFADRTHVMRDGRIVTTLTPSDAGNVDLMTEAYFGR